MTPINLGTTLTMYREDPVVLDETREGLENQVIKQLVGMSPYNIGEVIDIWFAEIEEALAKNMAAELNK